MRYNLSRFKRESLDSNSFEQYPCKRKKKFQLEVFNLIPIIPSVDEPSSDLMARSFGQEEGACRRCAEFDNTRQGFAGSTYEHCARSSFKLMRLRRLEPPLMTGHDGGNAKVDAYQNYATWRISFSDSIVQYILSFLYPYRFLTLCAP